MGVVFFCGDKRISLKDMIMKRRFTIKKREQARRFVENKIKHFNSFYGFKVNRVAIKNQTTRWGSCSSKGNLNFNYKIIYLRSQLADYLIVHELCHLGELNHSKMFWNLVSKTIPDFIEINKELRRTSVRLV